jgi:hypothetical protein
MHFLALAQVLILLSLANASPVIAKLFLGKTYARPIDGNTRFIDGRPLFGPSKTIRGLVVSLLLTALAAPRLAFNSRLDCWWLPLPWRATCFRAYRSAVGFCTQ